jgi:hypothetical protein
MSHFLSSGLLGLRPGGMKMEECIQAVRDFVEEYPFRHIQFLFPLYSIIPTLHQSNVL